MNSTSNQTAELKFKVGDRVLTPCGRGTIMGFTERCIVVSYTATTIWHGRAWFAENCVYKLLRAKPKPNVGGASFAIGERVRALTGEGTVTSTRRDPGTGAQHVDVCYVKGGVEHFKTYPAMDLWREIDEAKGRPVAAEAPKKEELVDAARRLGVDNCDLAGILGRLDNLSAKLQDANERVDRLKATLNHTAEARGKAVKALRRAGFVRDELSGEWKPPVNQAAADVRMLRGAVEAQREYIYSLKAAVLELRASEQLVRTHSGGPWVHRTPPSSVCARLQAAWAAVHLLLEQGEGADNG